MRIVLDTNIVFNILLNSDKKLGRILFDSNENFQFYSCSKMRFEIFEHWGKLKSISKLSDSELQSSFLRIISKIKFINEEIITREIWLASEELPLKIDPDDIAVVALAKGY